MPVTKRNLAKISVRPQATVREAMAVMTRGPKRDPRLPAGIVLVTAQDGRLLGVATDGDFRRALVRGTSLEAPVREVMNRRPFLIEGSRPNAELLGLVLDKLRAERWPRYKIRHVITVDRERRVLDVVLFFDLWRNSEIRFTHIGIVGLGYVGLTLALTLADHGFQVRGLEANLTVRRTLRRGRPHFFEAGLAELLGDHLGRSFEVVDGLGDGLECDIYIIAVGTPVDRHGQPQFGDLKRAARTVGRVLKQGDAVILRSTVPVGTTRDVVVPILETATGLTAGKDFAVAFAPERTVEGRALEELKRLPQVVGGIDRVSAEVAAHIFNTFTNYSIIVESPEEAEMVKLISNAYRDVTFAFSNELSLLCRRWGIDTRRVIEAANRDYERSNVPLPSPGVGGYCLKKDPYIFMASASRRGYRLRLAPDARAVSEAMVMSLRDEVMRFLARTGKPVRRAKVALLGLAFKGDPVTSDLRGSTALDLAALLRPRVGSLVGFDPAVTPRAAASYRMVAVPDVQRAVRGADVVVVMTNHPALRALAMRRLLATARRPALLIDAWGLYPVEEMAKVKGITHFRL